MTKYIRQILLIQLILLVSLKTSAQDYSIRNYSIVDDIKGINVYSAFQDNKGFIWFATRDGAFKFDGKKFIKFNLEGRKENNNVYRILQDSKGIFWFATLSEIQKFDGKSLVKYNLSGKNHRVLIRKMLEDDEGSIWFIGEKGIFKLKNSKLVDYTDKVIKEDEYIVDIVKGEGGRILFITNQSVIEYSKEKFIPISQFHELLRKRLSAFMLSRKGEVWTGDRAGDILIYNNGKIRKKSLANNVLNPIQNIFEDSEGIIWVSTAKGLFKSDGHKFELQKTYKDSLAKLVSYTFEDKEDNLWACTITGACKLQRKAFSKLNSLQELSAKNIKCIIEDNKGQIWFASESEGVYIFDGKYYKKFPLSDNKKVNRVSSIIQSRDGSFWFITGRGLVRLKDGQIKIFTSMNGLKSDFVSPPLFEDKDGNIWFRNANYICKYDGMNFTFPFISTKNDPISRFQKGADNEFWLGNNNEYKTLDGKTIISFKSWTGLSDQEKLTSYLKFDRENDRWAGFPGKGFARITSDGKLSEIISTKDGLVGNQIYSMKFDKEGFLWLGTGCGISRFDAERYKKTGQKVFENYRNPENEITSKTHAFLEDSKGNIWAGTSHGVIKFDAKLLNKVINPNPPQIHLTDLKLFLDKFNYLEYSDSLNPENGLPAHLKLPHTKNYLSFDFIGLNYTSPEDVEYKYRLNGFDSSWSPIVKFNEVTYTNLHPGEYKFEVLSRNKDGVWSTNPASISFAITPPFWKTWWFYSVCLLAGTFVIFGYIRLRTDNLEKQKRELEITVDLRTRELQEEKSKVEEINRELEKSRYQLAKINELQAKWLDDLSESEKQLIESNTNKDKLFSIISHDLKSPFRSLIMYSESVLGKLDSVTTEEIKAYTEDVHKYAENIYKLLEDLLDWSRIQIGGMEYEPKQFDISYPANQTLEMLRGNAQKKEINLVNNVVKPTYGYADENMIKSVMNNLVSNAIKFTNKGGIVEISSFQDNGYIKISVSDTGIGMNEEEMLKLFRIEKHFHKTGTSNEKGTGLGLILCKELIEKNKGTIFVQSKIGEGSRFTFTIPSSPVNLQ